MSSDTRPATTTFFGDTGLWFLPTGEVLGRGRWSVSGYRRGTNFVPGFTNVGDFAGTFGVGIGDRAEIFGSFLFDTRIDRDLRPLFSSDAEVGGIVPQYPRVSEYWTGDTVGDLFIGGKVNFWSEARQNPAALAVRGIVKLPTGDDEAGVSTGKADLSVDLVASKEAARIVELAGFAGFELRGEPDDVDVAGTAFRWGVGAARGEAPPPPPPPPPPAPPANRAPTVTAQCDPCTVEIGRQSTLTANATDPDGDVLTYRWTVPSGTLASPAARQTLWTAPRQEGTVAATVTVDDGRGGTASNSVNIQVTRPPVKEYTFEDVHFDFDRFSLRPDATRLLDEAVSALQQDATLRLQIEGHTCNIGAAEYNLALGDRRANSVRDYLLSRGVAANRLTTLSYGEERPRHDNTREETRRLNRRAALVVNLQR